MGKYYAVKIGRKPGLYHSWDECKKQINGFSGAVYKSFEGLDDANQFLGIKAKQTYDNEAEVIDDPIKAIDKRLKFTADQQTAFDLMMSGKNIFLTGEAGTGKSFVVNRFIKEMEKQHKNIIVCAPTGIAAINIGGATIHRCFQASLEPEINRRIKHSPKEVQKADVIIIDEISMCRVDLFDYVVRVIAKAEESSLKRKQLIVIGDFFQLPPVTTKEDRTVLEKVYPHYQKGFAFESDNWQDFNFHVIALKNIKRQNDKNFINALNRLRIGDPASIDYFNQNAAKEKIKDGIILCARNDVAKKINSDELNKLASRAVVYRAICQGDVKDGDKPTEDKLRLKVGARVIVLINDSEGMMYQNGSLGEVVELQQGYVAVKLDQTKMIIKFTAHEWAVNSYTVVEEKENGNIYHRVEKKKVGAFIQIPLKLAYAITIHKSQGQTYDKVNLIPYSFDCGQLYVALSRVKSIQGLCLLQRMTREYLLCSPRVKQFYQIGDYVDRDKLMARLGELVYQSDSSWQKQCPKAIYEQIQLIKAKLGA